MSPRDPRAYVQDMLDACSDIVEATAGVALADFMLDKLRHKAVVRDLEVLGEAAALLPAAARALAPDVPWREVVAMPNEMIHGYVGMDLTIVHRAAQVDIPDLIVRLQRADRQAGRIGLMRTRRSRGLRKGSPPRSASSGR